MHVLVYVTAFTFASQEKYLLNFQISLFTHLADAALRIELFNWFKSLRRIRLHTFPLKSTM